MRTPARNSYGLGKRYNKTVTCLIYCNNRIHRAEFLSRKANSDRCYLANYISIQRSALFNAHIVKFSRSCECTYPDVVFVVRAVRCYNLFIDILFSCMFILLIYCHNSSVFLESPNSHQSVRWRLTTTAPVRERQLCADFTQANNTSTNHEVRVNMMSRRVHYFLLCVVPFSIFNGSNLHLKVLHLPLVHSLFRLGAVENQTQIWEKSKQKKHNRYIAIKSLTCTNKVFKLWRHTTIQCFDQ